MGCVALDDKNVVETGAISTRVSSRQDGLSPAPDLLETSRPGVFAV